jgi:hypothetical protein
MLAPITIVISKSPYALLLSVMPLKAFKRATNRAATLNKRVKVNNSQSQSKLPVRTLLRKALKVAAS